ncbi:MAG: hypothetical protein AAF739_16450 [Pseudomonadota bacterium]
MIARPDPEEAAHFVEQLDLPPQPLDFGLESAGSEPDFASPDGSAVAIAGQLAGFTGAVPPEIRQNLSNALLLAQLAANKASEQLAADDIKPWFDTYFEVLEKVGFLLEDKKDLNLDMTGQSFEVRDVLIRQLTDALGQAASLASQIIELLKGLTKTSTKNPWYQLFDRQVRQQNADLFQLSDVRMDAATVKLTAIAIDIDSRSASVRVPLIGGASDARTLHVRTRGYAIDETTLTNAAMPIAWKLGAHIATSIAEIEI